MKLLGFVLIATALGLAISAYFLMPKNDETKKLVRLTKIVISIIVTTLMTLFLLATANSDVTIKLF